MKKRYTKIELLNSIKNFYAKHNRAPFNGDCLTEGLASNNVYQRHFGSWKNALIASEIPFLERNSPVQTCCVNCNKKFHFLKSELNKKQRKSNNTFCSRSCAAIYNNKNKNHGTRVSKLEKEIQKLLSKDFPTIVFEFNSKTAINSELDIYCPKLRFAIELNGIFHYEPIYGSKKFEQIINNDKQKLIACYKLGIELAIIDTSSCKYVTQKSISKYYQYVKELINLVIHRQNYS